MNKKIENIVEYKYYNGDKITNRVCVFYDDGSSIDYNLEEGKKEVIRLARQENYKTIEEFNNSKKIYHIDGKVFEKNFNNYKSIENIVIYDFFDNYGKRRQACVFYKDGTVKSISEEEANILKDGLSSDKIHYTTGVDFEKRFNDFKPKLDNSNILGIEDKSLNEKDEKSEEKEDNPVIDLIDFGDDDANIESEKPKKIEEKNIEDDNEFDDEEEIRFIPFVKDKLNNIKDKFTSSKNKDKSKKKGIFKRFKTKAIAIGTAAAIIAGSLVYGATTFFKKNKPDKAVNNQTKEALATNTTTHDYTDDELVSLAQKSKNAKNFQELKKLTTNETQLDEMNKISLFLDIFNGGFANKVQDKGSNIRPALKWNEVMALNLAYNNFSKDEIKAIFNGSTINVDNYDGYYKNATLQLMGSFVMEDREAPINLDKLINSEKGKNFYNKYNNLFLDAKEKHGQEQIDAVNKFYKELYKDFPISKNKREVGISHGDSRKSIKSYKLSVTPIVAASEMLFQNLEIDHTLSNKAIAYFNDTGLCNKAKDSFENAREILNGAETDTNNPLYKNYQKAKINELKENNWYNVSDKEREITKLSKFKNEVNAKFEYNSENSFTGNYSYEQKSSTSKSVKTVTKTTYKHKTTKTKTTSRKKAVKEAGEKAVKKAEQKVDKEIKKQNQEAKQQGEKEAKKNQQNMQKEADKEAESVKKEVEDNNKKTTDDMKDIKPGQTDDEINSNIHIDDDYKKDDKTSDEIKDGSYTPNGDGADEELPDPNKTGEEFDKNSPSMSNEEIASQMVEYMAAYPTTSSEYETSYQYTK